MMSASPDLAESCADTATHTVPSATLLHPLSSIDNDDAIQPGTEAGLLAQGRRKLVRKAAVIETETVEMIAKVCRRVHFRLVLRWHGETGILTRSMKTPAAMSSSRTGEQRGHTDQSVRGSPMRRALQS